jgi:2,4-diaminopentanoate dehydrogenase
MGEHTVPASTYRVVQWATGNIGSRSLRQVIGHPQLELVGLYVTAPEKEGRDAGELCGLGPTGIAATRDVEAVLAVDADCVLYMQQGVDIDVLCRLLESGRNVVATAGGFHHPPSMDPPDRDRVEAACQRGGTSIHSTGVSPGFISEAIPIVLTSLQRRLDRLQIEEFADLSSRDSPVLLFELMGYGRDPSSFDPERWAHGAASFGPSLRQVADAVGLPLDTVSSTGEVAVATRDIHMAAGTIPAGTVAGQRMTVSGLRHGHELMSFSATWYCSADLDADWDLRGGGWRVRVDGDCPLDVEIRLDVPLERMAESTPGYTANRAVNAVPVVCDAPPGIRTTVDLPQIVANLSSGPAPTPSTGGSAA